MQALFYTKTNTSSEVFVCTAAIVNQVDDEWDDAEEESPEANRDCCTIQRLDAIERDGNKEECGDEWPENLE
jgi:hypothetical protein